MAKKRKKTKKEIRKIFLGKSMIKSREKVQQKKKKDEGFTDLTKDQIKELPKEKRRAYRHAKQVYLKRKIIERAKKQLEGQIGLKVTRSQYLAIMRIQTQMSKDTERVTNAYLSDEVKSQVPNPDVKVYEDEYCLLYRERLLHEFGIADFDDRVEAASAASNASTLKFEIREHL
jgi:hypothetical protein